MRKETNIKKWIVGVVLMFITLTTVGQEKIFNYRSGQPIGAEYDTTKYFCLGINVLLEGKKVPVDNVAFFVSENLTGRSSDFINTDRTKVLLNYDTKYFIAVSVKGYQVVYFNVYTDVPKRDYNVDFSVDMSPWKNKDLKNLGYIYYDKITDGVVYYDKE